jgi:hypothetical protein
MNVSTWAGVAYLWQGKARKPASLAYTASTAKVQLAAFHSVQLPVCITGSTWTAVQPMVDRRDFPRSRARRKYRSKPGLPDSRWNTARHAIFTVFF